MLLFLITTQHTYTGNKKVTHVSYGDTENMTIHTRKLRVWAKKNDRKIKFLEITKK
jgi:hypothetical protein